MSCPRVTRECSDWSTKLRRCKVSDITCGPLAAALEGTAACPSRSAVGSQIPTGSWVLLFLFWPSDCVTAGNFLSAPLARMFGSSRVFGSVGADQQGGGGVRVGRFTNRRNVTGSWWRHQASCSLLGQSPPGSPPCQAPGTDSRPRAGSLAGPCCARRRRRHLQPAGSTSADDDKSFW